MRRRLATSIACLSIATVPALGADGLSASFGEGARNNVLDAYRVGIQWNWDARWFASSLGWITGYWDVSVAMFDNDSGLPNDDADSRLYACAIAPAFRLQLKPFFGAVAPFLDVAIGAAAFSDTELQDSGSGARELGGHFQFEDRITFGARLGASQRAEVSLQRMHYSNLGISGENDGIDTHLLTLAWHF
jgi:lipid A 3-O-deacylase